MGIAPLVFSGISKFSQDFQTIVSRSVAIASLPVNALKGDQETALAQKTALIDLRLGVADLVSSLKRLGALGNTGALTAASSSSKVGVTISDTSFAQQGLYQITEVTSLASRASATSATGVASQSSTPIAGGDLEMSLLVGGATYNFSLTPEQNNLEGIRSKINSLGAGVTASIMNTGDPSAPFFLTVTAIAAGQTSIELRSTPDDPGTNLLSQTAPGASAQFNLNGQLVTSNSNVVTGAVEGVTIKLHDTTEPGESITVELQASVEPVISEMQKFVSVYNALASKVGQHTGEAGGALAGDSLLNSLRAEMRSVFAPLGNGSIKALSELGISVNNDGIMTFTDSDLRSASASKLAGVLGFLSSESAGLAALSSAFEQFSAPVTGLIDFRLSSIDATSQRMDAQIVKLTERINAMQATLLAKLQAADSLLAMLERQEGMLDAATESLRFTSYGKKD